MGDATEKRIAHLDRIAADLERHILTGRGDLTAMRQEWRACQDEMTRLEERTMSEPKVVRAEIYGCDETNDARGTLSEFVATGTKGVFCFISEDGSVGGLEPWMGDYLAGRTGREELAEAGIQVPDNPNTDMILLLRIAIAIQRILGVAEGGEK